MLVFLIAPMLAAASPQTTPPPSPPGAEEYWQVSDGRTLFSTAGLSFPINAEPVNLERSAEFSRPGTGLDTGLVYRSRDREILATIYIYYPGLAHAGLTSFATNRAILAQSPGTRAIGTRLVGAGGQDNAAIRIDYSGYQGDAASSAAFLKSGRWIVKIRVSGPEARQSDVDATMSALLDRMRFEGDLRPREAAPLVVRACDRAYPRARPIPDGDLERQVEHWLVATIDGGGLDALNEQGAVDAPLPSRIATHWCQTEHALRGNRPPLLILRAESDAAGGIDGRSRMLIPVNDAGRTFELVERDAGRYVLLHHDVGRTDVLGSYESLLSDDQIANIVVGRDRDGGRVRAAVTFRPDGNTETEFRLPTR